MKNKGNTGSVWVLLTVVTLAIAGMVLLQCNDKQTLASPDLHLSSKGSINKLSGSWDGMSDRLCVLDFDHNMVHEGTMYRVQYVQSVTDTDDISAIVFSTPMTGGEKVHIVCEGQSTDQVEYKLLEIPSVDEGEATSVQVPFNRNRDSANTSGLYNVEPVKATGVLEWTGLGVELDIITIGGDSYQCTAVEGTATGNGHFWVDLGDAAAATLVTNFATSITANDTEGIGGADGAGNTIDLTADTFGTVGNVAVTCDGANVTVTTMVGGIGAPNDGGDTEIHGVVNSVSCFDKTDAAAANITTTTALVDEIIGQGAATPARDSQAGESGGQREWLLKVGTQYCLYMKSLNANDNVHTLTLSWYEYADAN